MLRFLLTLGICGVLLVATSCKRGRGDSLMEKKIELFNQLAEAIEKKDALRVQRIVDEWKEVNERMKQLNLTQEELQKLTEKYEGKWKEADGRYRSAAEKDPEFMRKVDSSSAK